MAHQVFIVEDDPAFLKIVEIRLRDWDKYVSISHAGTIADAKKLLDETSKEFHLVILDQHLPDGRGRELFDHPKLAESAVLAVSSDDSPDLPAEAMKAGAQHFLGKRQVSEPLFIPLIAALIERKKLERDVFESKLKESKFRTIKMLLATLRHEINNPLGAVLGGAYLLRSKGELAKEQAEALKLIEASGNRIKHVIQQLCETADLEAVQKAHEEVFHIPGDEPWEEKEERVQKKLDEQDE